MPAGTACYGVHAVTSMTTFSHALASRPEPQQSELVQALASLGLEVISLPVFRFEAGRTESNLWARAGGALLIFTSPRAVHFGLAALGGGVPDGARAAAIGPATHAELERHGIASLQASGSRHDSEALLATLEEEATPGQALIFAAPGGRKALEHGLVERGWEVGVEPVYRRVLLPPDPVEAERLADAEGVLSLWTSGTAMNQVLGGLPERLLTPVLRGTAIVVSERLAKLARERGFGAVIVAAGASNPALLATARACLDTGGS